MALYVDIPTKNCIDNPDGSFLHIGTFHTRKEAIKFCKKHFGADHAGRIGLISGTDDMRCSVCKKYTSDQEIMLFDLAFYCDECWKAQDNVD